MKNLPDKPNIKAYHPLAKEKYADMTALAYMTADACYQMMYDATNMLMASRQDFRQSTKRNFNRFFEAMENARKCALRVGDDVSTMSEKNIDWFFEDSDYLKNTLIAIYEKTKHNGDNAQKITDFLESL